MNWIEFIGPPGVGKSFLLSKLRDTRAKNSDWVLMNEAIIEIAKEATTCSFKDNLRQKYLKQSFIDIGKKYLTYSKLKFGKAYNKEAYRYEYLLERCWDLHQDTSSSVITKTRGIVLFSNIIEKLCLCDFYNYQEVVLMDEGPYANNPCLKTANNYPKTDIPKAFIFCNLEPQLNFARLKKRAESGELRPIHHGMDNEALKKRMEESHENFLDKKEVLKKIGIPFLEIDLKNIDEELIAEVNLFIKEIRGDIVRTSSE